MTPIHEQDALQTPFMEERETNSPLPVIQAVKGLPSKKATLSIISTVKRTKDFLQGTSCCPVKDKAVPAVVGGSCQQTPLAPCAGCGGGRRAACHGTAQPECHTGHAAPAQGSCCVGHWLLSVQRSPGQDHYSFCCQKLIVFHRQNFKLFIILLYSSGGWDE